MIRMQRASAPVRRGWWISVACVAGAFASAASAQISPEAEISSTYALPVASQSAGDAGLPVGRQWSADAVAQLIAVVEGACAEGLNPADYGLSGLRQAARSGPSAPLDAAATASAISLAHDYQFGRVRDRDDMGWMIRRAADEEAQLPARLNGAVASGQVGAFLASLLPTDARYVALRDALADAPDATTRDRLRANMERWRWLPRTMGGSHLYVNVPSYRLQVMDGGVATATYTVVVGARATPTPQLITPTSSLVVNPWWNVPQSIVRSANLRPGKAGYLFKAGGDGSYAVRQPPGPRNALGRIKFVLANDQAIYLHDTPAKVGFRRADRALSHGCIRVKDIDQLAGQLMSDAPDPGALDVALAGTDTATLRLTKTWPVYIVYFTVDSVEPGTIVSYGDPYGYDARVVARLNGNAAPAIARPLQIAAR